MKALLIVAAAAGLAGCGGCKGGGTGGDAGTDAGGGGGDATAATDAAATDAGGAGGSDAGLPAGWLYTAGNHVYTSDGLVFHGRGANIHDTRSCNACAYGPPSVAEVERRIDELVDVWGANFMRLDLESYATADFRVQWETVLDDPAYLADVVAIVDYIGTKPGVYVLVSLWVDPNHSPEGWPTAGTTTEWELLAATFALDPHVLFGIINEPQNNFDGMEDATVWGLMNDEVAAIRAVEDAMGAPHHVITVQGTGAWARRLDYYVTNPIAAGGGANVAYEIHVYDPTANFDAMLVAPAATLPVIIGEYGPAAGYMTETDCSNLMDVAEANEIPYLAWNFHMRCPPDLLVDNSAGGCGEGMALEPTSWGQLLIDRLALPW
jgi:endoglucanase